MASLRIQRVRELLKQTLGEAIRRGDGIRDLLQAALRQARANYALMQAMELILDTN